jgi:hypothetical protein
VVVPEAFIAILVFAASVLEKWQAVETFQVLKRHLGKEIIRNDD